MRARAWRDEMFLATTCMLPSLRAHVWATNPPTQTTGIDAIGVAQELCGCQRHKVPWRNAHPNFPLNLLPKTPTVSGKEKTCDIRRSFPCCRAQNREKGRRTNLGVAFGKENKPQRVQSSGRFDSDHCLLLQNTGMKTHSTHLKSPAPGYLYILFLVRDWLNWESRNFVGFGLGFVFNIFITTRYSLVSKSFWALASVIICSNQLYFQNTWKAFKSELLLNLIQHTTFLVLLYKRNANLQQPCFACFKKSSSEVNRTLLRNFFSSQMSIVWLIRLHCLWR